MNNVIKSEKFETVRDSMRIRGLYFRPGGDHLPIWTARIKYNGRHVELKEEIAVVAGLAERCVNENARAAMDQDEYNERYDGLARRYEGVKADHDNATQEIADRSTRKKQMEQFIRDIEDQEPVKEFDEGIWCSLVDCVTVYSGKRMEVTFKDGTEV